MEVTNQHFLNDSAIQSTIEDKLNYNYFAEKVDLIIQKNIDNPEPLVVGIYGEWGEGKTSFLNLLNSHLGDYKGPRDVKKRILRHFFNPWRYTNEDEMLYAFFNDLSKKLLLQNDSSLKKTAKHISNLLGYIKELKLSAKFGLSDTVTATLTTDAITILKNIIDKLSGKKKGLEELNMLINSELLKSNYKIVIFIDDIDRLDKDEIFTILKIIKLNANFKNIIYVVPLDIEHVAKAIHSRYGNEIKDGKKFLEKIFNIPIFLPRIEKENLKVFFETKFEEIIKNLPFEKEKRENEYKDILDAFNRFSFSSPREIIRLLNSFYLSAFAIGEHVNLHDLFWIEYLKISDEECYDYIKKYNLNTQYFYEIEDIIDFNDDNHKNFPNGTREYLLKTYTRSKSLLEYLFPEKQNNQFDLTQDSINKKLKNELRINTYNHFEKYFSLNPIGKVSEKHLKNLEQKIVEKDFEQSKILLKELFKNNKLAHKTLYRIRDLIYHIENTDIQNLFFLFITENIYLIPSFEKDMFGRDEHNKLIESFARTLNKDINNNADIILEIASKLNVENLCFFTRKIDKNSPVRKELESLIIEKTKTEFSFPFYEKPEVPYNKMIMQIWGELNPQELNNYIKKTINKNNIGNLIRNFPTFWDSSYFGSFTSENLKFMKKLINIDFIYQKLKEYYPEIIDEKIPQDEKMKWSDRDQSSIMDNIKQFITLYKRDNESKKL
ncbi:P-loop NTPase fold protein [Flavobacterium rakeshii]|uniref:KAP family P-loop NTPase fold protein n=1 Tax=Flavobacterium rakeshii TaxID=1038845 RepID=UPI002E7BFE1D|nr:P-loop NTPase fold protein [Flavobacterium rakeshii]MEE1899126.1 P-loop NTPase fold protein [Flavobacterium rakeshii]